MESILNQLASNGIVGLMLAIVLYFLWPVVKRRLDECTEANKAFAEERKNFSDRMDTMLVRFGEERKDARMEFTSSLRARDVMIAEVHQKNIEALNNLSGEFKALRDDVKELKHV